MTGGFGPKDAKAVVDGGVAAKGFNVDLGKNRSDSARSRRTPTWWSKKWRGPGQRAVIISRR